MANDLSPALPCVQAHPTVYSHLHTAHINFLHLNSPSIKCENGTALLLRRLCETDEPESYKNTDTVFNGAALVAKIDLMLLPGGSGEERSASKSALMRYKKGKGLVLMFVLS